MILPSFTPVRALTTEVHPTQAHVLLVLEGLLETATALTLLGRQAPTPETADSDGELCIQARAVAEQAHAGLLPLLDSPSPTFNQLDVRAALDQSVEIVQLATDLYAHTVGISQQEAYTLLLGRCNPLAR